MMKKPEFKVIQGSRQELEFRLLRALFTPDGRETVAVLSKQLARKGQGRLQAVKAPLPEDKTRH